MTGYTATKWNALGLQQLGTKTLQVHQHPMDLLFINARERMEIWGDVSNLRVEVRECVSSYIIGQGQWLRVGFVITRSMVRVSTLNAPLLSARDFVPAASRLVPGMGQARIEGIFLT